MPRRAIVSRRERLKSEDRLQFEHVLAACLRALGIVSPAFDRLFDLCGHELQQRGERRFIGAQHPAGIAHVAKLDGKAQAIGATSVLVGDREVGFGQRVVPYDLILRVRQDEKTVTRGG